MPKIEPIVGPVPASASWPIPGPGFWYLAGPYSADISFFSREHKRTAAVLVRAGIKIFSPIGAWHDIAKEYSLPTDAKWWEDLNHTFVDRSNGLILLSYPNWLQSKGTVAEFTRAKRQGLPVWGLEPLEDSEGALPLFHWRAL